MPLADPPVAAGSLSGLPGQRLSGVTLHRVWRHRSSDGTVRPDPWCFASIPDEPSDGGRFDLAAPMGTCYLATSAAAAVLEALQAHLRNLPTDELVVRRRAEAIAPADAPKAAKLTAQRLAGEHGVTAELWAGPDRLRTQAWAAALRRDGWWATYAGVAHDPSGRLRAVALFDHAGAHPPTLGGPWSHTAAALHDDEDLKVELARYGVTVRDRGDLPFVQPGTLHQA